MSRTSPLPSRADRKRAEIIEIAQDLFFREGYAGTSMSQIAAAVGGSKTTLYSYFKSKEELLLAVVRDVVEMNPAEYDLAGPPSEFRAWLTGFGCTTMKMLTTYKYISLQRLAAAEALRFPEIGRMFDEIGVEPFYTTVMAKFAEAMDAGVVRRADPRVAVEQFMEMSAGWLLRRAVWNIRPTPSQAEIEENVCAAVSAFMDGYAPRREKLRERSK
jgi:TetR/AcrR family transcriptional regulator, mexJK operon transcriptional repressor